MEGGVQGIVGWGENTLSASTHTPASFQSSLKFLHPLTTL